MSRLRNRILPPNSHHHNPRKQYPRSVRPNEPRRDFTLGIAQGSAVVHPRGDERAISEDEVAGRVGGDGAFWADLEGDCPVDVCAGCYILVELEEQEGKGWGRIKKGKYCREGRSGHVGELRKKKWVGRGG